MKAHHKHLANLCPYLTNLCALFFSTFNEKPSRNQHYGRTRCSRELTPNGAEKSMAYDIITRFWSEEQAKEAQGQFEALFQKRDYTSAQEVTVPKDMAQPLWIIDLLKNILGQSALLLKENVLLNQIYTD